MSREFLLSWSGAGVRVERMEQREEFKQERPLYNGSETSQGHLVEEVDYLEKSEPNKNWKGFFSQKKDTSMKTQNKTKSE